MSKQAESLSSRSSRIRESSRRMAQAFSRLEDMIEEAVNRDGAGETELQARCEALETEIASLKQSNKTLAAENKAVKLELESTKKNHDNLQKVADAVAARLDDQIDQLDLITH